MKYTFNFKETNYGKILLESDHLPENSEIIRAILDGKAFLKNTEINEIKLIETTKSKPKPKRDFA